MRLQPFFFFIPLFFFALISCDQEAAIIYFVRHAEKDLTDTTDNPPLTTEGLERADRLVNFFENVQFDAIYSTRYDRNINTVKPLASDRNLPIRNYEWHDWQPMLDSITSTPGKMYLICGHGDNILPMIEYLGAPRPMDELGSHEYDKIFRVIHSPQEKNVNVLIY
jgi:2,3-bisphosphoglycerate-dependent phosphoglycerate mutase